MQRSPETRTPSAQVTRVGVEVDGPHVAAVQVVNGAAAAARVVTAATSAEALTQALTGLPAGVEVTITVAGETHATARFAVPEPPTTREELSEVIAAHVGSSSTANRALIGPGVTVAAAFRPPAGVGLRWAGLVMGWPAAGIASAYALAGEQTRATVRVVPTPVAGAGAGDLVLALRETNSELTLSFDGIPAATAHLAAGGLGIVEAVLGSGDAVGAARTEEALARGGVRDPMAGGELERWLREVLDEVSATIANWRSDGLAVPSRVLIYGRAARAVALNVLLADYGLQRAQTPPALARGLLKVDPDQRHQVTGAYLAAIAPVGAGHLLGDLATFDDPTRRLARAARARTARRVRALRIASALVVTLGVALAGPSAAVKAVDAWTQSRVNTLTEQTAAAAGVSQPAALYLADALVAESALPAGVSASVITEALAAAHPDATITGVTASPLPDGTTRVDVTADIPQQVATADLTNGWRSAGYLIEHVRRTPSTSSSAATLSVAVVR